MAEVGQVPGGIAAAPGTRENASAAASALVEALRANDLARAESELEDLASLCGRSPDDPLILLFRVTIAIQRGQARDALHYLHALGEETCPELRVLCLNSLQDPCWEGQAQQLAESSSSPVVREAMARMLEVHAAAATAAR